MILAKSHHLTHSKQEEKFLGMMYSASSVFHFSPLFLTDSEQKKSLMYLTIHLIWLHLHYCWADSVIYRIGVVT